MKSNGEKNIIKHFIRADSIVFDVGANKGKWSKKLLHYHPSVFLYAFEPIPEVYGQLEEMLKDRGVAAHISVHNIALSNKIKPSTFVFYKRDEVSSQWSSFFRRECIEKQHTIEPLYITVQTDTVSHFCKEHQIKKVDFLKIDTKGAEYTIIQGSRELIRNHAISFIQFKYGGTYTDAQITLKAMYQFLTAYNYKIYRITNDGLIHITKWRDELENFQYSNYLATYMDLNDLSNSNFLTDRYS